MLRGSGNNPLPMCAIRGALKLRVTWNHTALLQQPTSELTTCAGVSRGKLCIPHKSVRRGSMLAGYAQVALWPNGTQARSGNDWGNGTDFVSVWHGHSATVLH